MKNKIIQCCSLFVLLLLSGSAMAHTGSHNSSLLSGLMHPLSGLDHILAILAVGFWTATLNKSSKQLLIPVAFVIFMILGALIGVIGIGLPMLEASIALTVVFMGLLLMTKSHTSLVAEVCLVGVFALLHGNAHGLEIALGSTIITYFIGFVAGTCLLLGAGFYAGRQLTTYEWTIRGIGMTTSFIGAALMLGA